MALDANVAGLTGTKADVDSNHNLLVALSNTPASIGGVRMFSENDPGTVTGSPYLKSPETSGDYRLRVGLDTLLYDHTFSEITNLDTSRIKLSGIATMTAAMAGGGYLSLNASGAATASGNYVSFSTCRCFRLRGASQLYVEIDGNISAAPITNQVLEIGLFLPVAGTAPADGVYWQLDQSGLKGVINFGGTVTQTGVLMAAGSITPNQSKKWTLAISDTEVEFWADDVFLGEIPIPTGQSSPCLTDSLPVTLQQRNSGVVAGSGQMITRIGGICVSAGDLNYVKPFASQMAGMGHCGYQGQAGGTAGTTAAYPNATAATTLTGTALSQTAAVATGLGGQATITAAVPGIDGAVFAFQNPVGSTTQPPRNLTVTGIKISALNLGAAVATTPTTLAWSLGFGATGATIPTLAATETQSLAAASVKAWRRIPLGFSTFLVGALVGQKDSDIYMKFDSPVVIHPGEWIAVVGKFIQGTATASQVIHVHATYDAHFD